jgi:NAD(P)-dependent dehydrogenase (short-subunit alcohol dehydrogenase family)
VIPHLIIAGYGPGLGQAIKELFEKNGYHVTSLARSTEQYPVDLSNAKQTKVVIRKAIAEHGPPDTVIHNVAVLIKGKFLNLDAADFEQAWRSIVLSAVNISHAVIPAMQAQGKGTLILTGATASMRGSSGFSPFSSAKFALRGLAQSLAREFQPHGIHVVHPVIDGIIWSELSLARFPNIKQENCLQPEELAKTYWDLAHQSPSAWTHELDIRPSSEHF